MGKREMEKEVIDWDEIGKKKIEKERIKGNEKKREWNGMNGGEKLYLLSRMSLKASLGEGSNVVVGKPTTKRFLVNFYVKISMIIITYFK